MDSKRLEKEQKTYELNKESLLAAHEGKYVLIHGEEVAGTWDTYRDALEAGYKQFGLEPFMVKQITGIERIQHISRNILPCQS